MKLRNAKKTKKEKMIFEIIDAITMQNKKDKTKTQSIIDFEKDLKLLQESSIKLILDAICSIEGTFYEEE